MNDTLRIYLVQFNQGDKVDQTKFEPVAAETVRGAALKFASGQWPWPAGRTVVEVLVVPPNAPRHANGMPMNVHCVKLSVRGDDEE